MQNHNDRKRILITGGAGFLGSNLYARLFADGHDAMGIDNFFPGTKDNIAHLVDNPCFEDRCADGSGVVRATDAVVL